MVLDWSGSFDGEPRMAVRNALGDWPTIRPELGDLLHRRQIRKYMFAFYSTQMVEKGELDEEDRPL
jgi:hypothetical protein